MVKRLSLVLTLALLVAMMLVLSMPMSVVAQDAEPTPMLAPSAAARPRFHIGTG